MSAEPSKLSAESHRGESESASEAATAKSATEMPTSSVDAESFSDVAPVDASYGTAQAPSFRPPTPPPPKRVRPVTPLEDGDTIDDFEIMGVLGRGAFGVVYLARQMSLDRQVALKVAANQGSEGRTMARLEHRHIVQVFSETVTQDGHERLLCMQLVPGAPLQKLIQEIRRRSGDEYSWRGANLLKILDSSANVPLVLDPSALHDRQALEKMDDVEATAWIGARLGEALDYAHHQGVLHRDIKPANILMNQYGQPLLADFNISQRGEGDRTEGQFGGTLPYMSPEHLDAFNPSVVVGQDAVTEQSDIYSLGLVLYELLTGKSPFPQRKLEGNMAQRVTKLAEERRGWIPTCSAGPPDSRKVLEQAIAQCLEPEPERRFASGADLAEVLDGCRRMRHVERELAKPYAATKNAVGPLKFLVQGARRLHSALHRILLHYPLLCLVVFALLPHVFGSAINFWYNSQQIVGKLSPHQDELFWRVGFVYNAIVYPLVLCVAWWVLKPVWTTWRAMGGTRPVDTARIDAARCRAVQLPLWAAGLAAVGWLPGGVLFPLIIDMLSGLEDKGVYLHFVASFTLSGLIAIAYSYCGVHYVVLQVLYPKMWRDPRHFHERVRQELTWMPTRHYLIFILAGSIPLLAAITLGLTGRDALPLMMTLIALGWLGYEMARAATARLTQTLVALTGSDT